MDRRRIHIGKWVLDLWLVITLVIISGFLVMGFIARFAPWVLILALAIFLLRSRANRR